MTPDETVVLARYVRALCPQQKFDEYTPDAWHDVLGGYPLAAARAAAAAVAGRQPFVSPAEIIDEIRKQRDARADSFQGPGLPAEIPDADPDDVPAYLAALRAQRTRAADGFELKPRKVATLIAGVGREVPPEITEVKRPGPLGIDCPNCGAAIGRPCRTPGGSERAPCGPCRPQGCRRREGRGRAPPGSFRPFPRPPAGRRPAPRRRRHRLRRRCPVSGDFDTDDVAAMRRQGDLRAFLRDQIAAGKARRTQAPALTPPRPTGRRPGRGRRAPGRPVQRPPPAHRPSGSKPSTTTAPPSAAEWPETTPPRRPREPVQRPDAR
ncbi:hypothetical protein ACFQ2B_27690 [Streptomyces stramineus]